MQDLAEKDPSQLPSPKSDGARRGVILKFILWWLSSLLLLVGLALLTNIEWMRPRLQESLTEAFHRRVSLGKLSWQLGLNGLAIETDRFTVVEDSGKPFIASGPSEIGLAFLPLFERKVIVKHLQFDTPEVWAVKKPDGTWNFSDLLTEGPEIHIVQIDKGLLHLRNEGKEDKWSAFDLEDIKLKLVFPRKDKESWPLYFSCRVGNGKEMASVRFNLTGKGPFDQWKTQDYNGELELDNFNPRRFEALFPWLPDLNGHGNLKVTARGVFDKGVDADLSLKVREPKFLLAAPVQPFFEPAQKNVVLVGGRQEPSAVALPDLSLAGKVRIDKDKADWTDLKLVVDRFAFDTSGSIQTWTSEDRIYKVNIGGSVEDLDDFASRILAPAFPHSKVAHSLSGATDNAKAAMSLRLHGNHKNMKMAAVMKADGVPLGRIMKAAGYEHDQLPVKLDPNSQVSGELAVDAAKNSFELSDVLVTVDQTKLRLSGKIDSTAGDTELVFSVHDLPVASLTSRLTGKEFGGVPLKAGNLGFDGNVDIEGVYKVTDKQTSVKVKVVPLNVALVTADKRKLVRNLKGEITSDGRTTTFTNMVGTLEGAGTISASGSVTSKSIQVKAEGRSLDTVVLKELAGQTGMQFPTLSITPQKGMLRELTVWLTGKPNSPELARLDCKPEDLQIEVTTPRRTQQRIVHLAGGSLHLAGGVLNMEELSISSRGSRAVVSAKVKGVPAKPDLEYLSIRTDGFDLGEWQPFIKPGWLSTAAKDVPPFLLPHHNTSLQGKVFGDFQLVNRGKLSVDAVLGLHNISGTFGRNPAHVEKVTGIVSVNDKTVRLQDLSGVLGRSQFSVDGGIDDYQDAGTVSWNGVLKGRFYGEEVTRIIDLLGANVKASAHAGEALALRLAGKGNAEGYRIFLSGKAEPALALKLGTDYGVLNQPPDKRLQFDGVVLVTHGQATELQNLTISAGEERFEIKGKLDDSRVDLALSSAGKVSARTLAQMVPAEGLNASELSGAVSFDLGLEGPLDALKIHGNMSTDKVNLPSAHLKELTAKFDIPYWSLAAVPNGKPMKARAEIESVSVGELRFADGQVQLDYMPGSTPRIVLSDGEAKMAGGKLAMQGYWEPRSGQYKLELVMNNLGVEDFVKDLIERDGKVTGNANVALVLSGSAKDPAGFINGLGGEGKFNVVQGTVVSFGKLQEKLNGANLLQQGVFGFNINNLVQTMMPVNNGAFKEIEGNIRIEKGIVFFDEVRYDGQNLRLRAAGKLDLPKGQVALNIAGDIPRVASSIIPGPIGEVSRNFTLQRFVKIITFKRLKDLPSLPLLGDIANDDPRAFQFSVEGPIDKPKYISQSVEKSFHWLPNKPYASAHPVPGI